MKHTRDAVLRLALASALSFLGFSLWSPLAQAEGGDASVWVGALFGLSVPNASNTSSRTTYGLTGGAKVGSELGVGGYYLTSHKDEDVAGTKVPFDYDLYGVEGAYHFEGEAKGVYLGGRLGVSKVKAGTVDGSPMNFGAMAGYNYFLGDHFSLGGEVNFMSVEKAGSINGFTMLNFLASAKAWF